MPGCAMGKIKSVYFRGPDGNLIGVLNYEYKSAYAILRLSFTILDFHIPYKYCKVFLLCAHKNY